MIRAFNAFQCTSVFAVGPTLLTLCKDAAFQGAQVVFWVGCIVYLILFVMHVIGMTRLFCDL